MFLYIIFQLIQRKVYIFANVLAPDDVHTSALSVVKAFPGPCSTTMGAGILFFLLFFSSTEHVTSFNGSSISSGNRLYHDFLKLKMSREVLSRV